MNRDYQKRREPMTDNSEALVHETSPYYRDSHEKRVSGYEQNPAEKEARGEPKELFSMNNSYNNISIGADKKGDMMVTGSAVRRHDSETLENEEKRVEGSRRKKHPTNFGDFYTNPAKPDESAFAYRVNRRVPEKQILRQIRESSRKHNLGEYNDTLPFMDVKEDEEALDALRQKEASESEKQDLEKTVRDKKVMEHKFLKNLRFARNKMNNTDLDELIKEFFGNQAAVLTQIPLAASEDSSEDDTDTDTWTSDDELSGGSITGKDTANE